MRFLVELMIHGFHKYEVVWDNSIDGEGLLCECEVGNPHDTHTVVVKKVIYSNLTTVGQIPWRESSIYQIFWDVVVQLNA